MRQLDNCIYIDALALVPEKKSGVGYTLEQTLLKLIDQNQTHKLYTIYLVVPLGKAKYLKKYLQTNVGTKNIYLPARIFEILLRLRLFPPVDWLLGAGVYIFPNYRNWPLWHSRSLTYVYDVSFIKFPEMVQPKNQKYLSRYINRWVSRTDRIITISNQVRNEIEKELNQPYAKIAVVYCGVDPATFYRRKVSEVETVKEKYGIYPKNYFLFVGNIEPRKNLKTLLSVYEKLPPDIMNKYGLVIVGGDSWLSEEFNDRLKKTQLKGLTIVQPNQYVITADLPALYSGARALIHPAIYEGFGITPLEAMACGTPVIASAIPAIKEVSQGAAFYFDPFEPGSISRAIINGLTDDRAIKEHLAEGRLRADKLTWANTAAALGKVIEEEIRKGPHRWPMLSKLKLLYVFLDLKIRKMLGDKTPSPYHPQQRESLEQLRVNIYNDFLKEQPSYIQAEILKAYLLIKHVTAQILKSIYHNLKAQK